MQNPNRYVKNGYLHEEYRLFHLKDNLGDEKEYHYHEFNKAVIFISGKVDYLIEGTTYPLRPWDILLISDHTLHKALIDTSEDYERIILYISPYFADKNGTEKTSLMKCFRKAESDGFYLLRLGQESRNKVKNILYDLEHEMDSEKFGSDILARNAVLQLLICLNRAVIDGEMDKTQVSVFYDPKIASVITYINENLDKDMSVDALASRCYISKYHFMRKCKDITGYTVHGYILQKRLMYASDLIKNGVPASRAASMSGFKDYSTFQRAFKKVFGISPSKILPK